MNTRTHYSIALLIIGAILSGCATTRSVITLTSPQATNTPQTTAKSRTVIIRSVKDERVFEQAPKVPSIPSLGYDDIQRVTEDTKARAVGRKRGGYGKALGDVLLDHGQSVAGLVRENLTTVFEQAGYRVVNETTAEPTDLVVDVHIKQFWAWFNPGFWAITLDANIETDLDVSGIGTSTTISVHVEDSRQMATEDAWREILEKALLAYQTQAAQKLSQPPF